MASLSDAPIRQMLNSRYVAALATENLDESIHMVAVWYWFSGNPATSGISSCVCSAPTRSPYLGLRATQQVKQQSVAFRPCILVRNCGQFS